jgi:hypothetical protein
MSGFSIYKIREQEGETGPVWALVQVGGGRRWIKSTGE